MRFDDLIILVALTAASMFKENPWFATKIKFSLPSCLQMHAFPPLNCYQNNRSVDCGCKLVQPQETAKSQAAYWWRTFQEPRLQPALECGRLEAS